MFRVPKSRSQDGYIGQWDAGHWSPSQQQNNSYRLHSFYEKENCIICAVQARYFVVVAFQNISITLVLES